MHAVSVYPLLYKTNELFRKPAMIPVKNVTIGQASVQLLLSWPAQLWLP